MQGHGVRCAVCRLLWYSVTGVETLQEGQCRLHLPLGSAIQHRGCMADQQSASMFNPATRMMALWPCGGLSTVPVLTAANCSQAWISQADACRSLQHAGSCLDHDIAGWSAEDVDFILEPAVRLQQGLPWASAGGPCA